MASQQVDLERVSLGFLALLPALAGERGCLLAVRHQQAGHRGYLLVGHLQAEHRGCLLVYNPTVAWEVSIKLYTFVSHLF